MTDDDMDNPGTEPNADPKPERQDVLDSLPEEARDEAVAMLPHVFMRTDMGNAERMAARYRDRIRFCVPRKRWLVWDGKRWKWDDRKRIEFFAKRVVRAIYSEAESVQEESTRKAIAKHAVASETKARLEAMVALCQSEPGIPILPHELDSDPWAFNVLNGTVDLKTGGVRQHRREDHMTKLSSVNYQRDARAPVWEQFLHDATSGDSELEDYLQRAVGYALQGTVQEKAFWFLYGPPDGMKSTFIDAVAAAFGEYAESTDFTTWLVQSHVGGNRDDIVALLGSRLVTSVEVRRSAQFDTAMLKRITGDDKFKAAAKYESLIEFAPTFAVWLAANDAPIIRDDDTGMWSRVRRVPFTNALPPEKQDRQMRDKLTTPDVSTAVLAWGVQGCLLWQEKGLGKCAAIERSNAAYRSEMDRLADFFEDRCEFGNGFDFWVAKSLLRETYDKWCRVNGIRVPLNLREFKAKLESRGCGEDRSSKLRIWRGIRLLTESQSE